MSFLWRFNGGGGGGGIAGTAVDPLSPSGVLIAPSEIVDPGAPVPAGWVLTATGTGGYVASPPTGSNSFTMPFSHDAGVPPGGTRYLRYGQNVISSSTGFRLTAAGTLRGIAIAVQLPSATNSYVVEVLSDPAGKLGPPVVLATLVLAVLAAGAQVTSLAVAVPITTEVGARVIRASGAGGGLGQIAVALEFSVP